MASQWRRWLLETPVLLRSSFLVFVIFFRARGIFPPWDCCCGGIEFYCCCGVELHCCRPEKDGTKGLFSRCVVKLEDGQLQRRLGVSQVGTLLGKCLAAQRCHFGRLKRGLTNKKMSQGPVHGKNKCAFTVLHLSFALWPQLVAVKAGIWLAPYPLSILYQ